MIGRASRRLLAFGRGLLGTPPVEPEETAEYIRIETVPGKYTLVDFPNVLWMGVTEFADLYQDSVVGSTRKEAVAWANVQVEKRRQAYVEATGRAL